MKAKHVKTSMPRFGICLSLAAVFASSSLLTGCQTTIGGQTLPSPDYLKDDVQFHPAGPEFKLSKKVEAANKQAAARQGLPPGP